MASNVSELVVSLGLNTASFSAKINEVNRTMKLVESQFKNSGAGVKDFEKSAQGLSEKLNSLNSKLDGAKTKINLYNEEIKKTKDSLKEHNSKLEESRKKVDDLSKKYDESVSTLGKNAKATKELKQELSLAEKELTKNEKAVLSTSNKLKSLETNLNNTEAEFKNLTEQIKSTQSAINGFSWNKLSEDLNDMSSRLNNAGDKMISIGKTMSLVSAAITGLGVGAVKTATDFEAGMAKVQATADATGEELEKLTAKALEMGAKTVFSASESAEALNYMAQAGWNTQQMIDGLEGVMNLAAASGEDLGLVSDIVTDSLTSFGMSAKQSAEFADILAKASAASNTNVAMMGETFKYVAPVAGALGFNAYDVSVAIGLMANAGIKASMAGTSLRQIFTNLGSEVKIVGGEIGETTIAMADSSGNMRDLHDIIVDLRKAFSGLTEVQKAANAENLAGKTGMSGLLAIVNASEQDFNNLTKAINNSAGASKKMADIMNNSTKGQFKLLMSQVEGIAIKLGNILLPMLNDLMSKISNLLTWFDGLNESTQKIIVTIAGLTAVIGPLLIGLGSVTKSVGTLLKAGSKVAGFFGGVASSASSAATATAAASASTAGMATGMASLSTIMLPVAGAVAALAGGIAIYTTNNELMNGTILDTTDDMGLLQTALDKLNGGLSKSKSELQEMGLVYKDFGDNISEGFIAKVEESTKAVNDLALFIGEINLDNNLNSDEIENFKARVADMCAGTIETIKSYQEESSASMKEMFLTDGTISEQEKKVLELMNKNSTIQIEETTKLQDEINKIISKAVKDKRGLNEQEIADIQTKVNRIKQIELEALGATQEEIEYAKNEFIARIAGIDLEGAQKLLSDKMALRDEEKVKISASYDTNIAILKKHLETAEGEEKAAIENEIANALKAKDEKLKIQDDLYNEYVRILGEKNPEILNQINRFNAELLTKQDLKAQASLEKLKGEYENMNQITEDGLYHMYSLTHKTWRDVRVEVDESTGEIIGIYDTYNRKSGGYTKSIVEQLKELQSEYLLTKNRTLAALDEMEGSTVDSEGNIKDAYGNIIGTLEDVQTASDDTRTGIVDLNGTPITVKVDSKNAISNLDEIRNAINSIPTVKNIKVVSNSGGKGFTPMPYSLTPEPTAINEDIVPKVSPFSFETPDTLRKMRVNSGYSSVGDPTPRNIERLSSVGGQRSESSTDVLLRQLIELLSKDNNPNIEVPVVLNGREIARASAKYMDTEINNINVRKNRLGGAF